MELLTPEDQEQVLAQVNRLADQQLGELRLAPQDTPRPGWRNGWRMAAQSAGLLRDGGEDTGLTLWSPGMTRTSVRVLRRLARRDAGAALLLHREAQGGRLRAQLDDHDERIAVAGFSGAQGLGRRALARWLRAGALDEADQAELAGNWGPDAQRLLWSGDWQLAFVPVWTHEGLQWWQLEAGQTRRSCHRHAHAFEGLEAQTLVVRAGRFRAWIEPGLLCELLIQEQLALLAIGAGVLDQARARAIEYADYRTQGGYLIRDWPAVQQLLADMQRVTEALEEPERAEPDQGPSGLARVLRARIELAPATSRTCNQAMQVFGGSGYMQDTGVERLVREANALRVISGSPLFLPLLAQHLEQDG